MKRPILHLVCAALAVAFSSLAIAKGTASSATDINEDGAVLQAANGEKVRLYPGMLAHEVLELLGAPQKITRFEDLGAETWLYRRELPERTEYVGTKVQLASPVQTPGCGVSLESVNTTVRYRSEEILILAMRNGEFQQGKRIVNDLGANYDN